MAATAFWIIFDAIVSVVGLNRPFYYLGDTARMDIFFKKLLGAEVTFILKLVLLIIAVFIALKF